MNFKKLLALLLVAGALQSGSLFSSEKGDDIITRYRAKTRKTIDAKTGKAKQTVKSKTTTHKPKAASSKTHEAQKVTKTTTHKPKTTHKATKTEEPKALTRKHTPAKASEVKDVKTSTKTKSITHDLNPKAKEHLRDPKTGRFETEAQAHPHDAKTGRFTSKRAATGANTLGSAGLGNVGTATGGNGLGAAALGSATAAGLARKTKTPTSKTTHLTEKQKEARKAALDKDREVARANTDWKRSKNIEHYGRYDKLKHDTKDVRQQYGWRWLKAPWSGDKTGDAASYAFWNGQHGWMYKDKDQGKWWHPQTGRWGNEPEFEPASKTSK